MESQQISNELELLKKDLEVKPFSNKKYKCHWCKKVVDIELAMIEGDLTYYNCMFHNNSFCPECALRKGEIPSKESAKCKLNSIDRLDCIWTKRNLVNL